MRENPIAKEIDTILHRPVTDAQRLADLISLFESVRDKRSVAEQLAVRLVFDRKLLALEATCPRP
jgi:hypothetical protein